jgi:hypothetical protein
MYKNNITCSNCERSLFSFSLLSTFWILFCTFCCILLSVWQCENLSGSSFLRVPKAPGPRFEPELSQFRQTRQQWAMLHPDLDCCLPLLMNSTYFVQEFVRIERFYWDCSITGYRCRKSGYNFFCPLSAPASSFCLISPLSTCRHEVQIDIVNHITFRYIDHPHCNENPFYVFFFWELRGLSPNFHIHVSVSDLYIPRIGPHIFLQQNRQIDHGNI